MQQIIKLEEIKTKEQVFQLIQQECINRGYTLKHKLAIQLPYDSGLRVSELINLKIIDINFRYKKIFVIGGKGKKDRITIFSEKTKQDIQEYLRIRKNKANPYMFDKGSNYHITTRTIWKILKRQAKECNIAKKVHPHILRSSFATHLLENGDKEPYIQHLLGHSNRNTTNRYTRIAEAKLLKIDAPLDLLG